MKLLRLPVLIVCGILGVVAGTVLIERTAINQLLDFDARAEATSWTRFLADNMPPSFMDVGTIGEETRTFIDRVKPASRVFLFKVYSASGHLVYVSDDRPLGPTDTEGLFQHNEEAAEAIERGEATVESKEGAPPARPAFYSEAYVPLRDATGAVMGVVESYIDQTEKRQHFQQAFSIATIALSALVAAAFLLPAIGWYRRRRGQERADAQVRYIANHDTLSEMLNRNGVVARLKALLADENCQHGLAVHSIDIDGFKDINGAFGMEGGDEFLKAFAERLRQVAGPDDILARLAGDEFLVIQTGVADAGTAEAFARHLVDQLARPIELQGHAIVATVCIGTALSPEHGAAAGRLMKNAKLALGHAKALGRGRITMFRPDFDDELQRRLTVERAINDALARDGFGIHFQPLYGVSEGALIGFEALARLQTERDGFISPVEFIPAAEQMGVIDQIGAFMIGAACTAASNWPEALTVSVNLSPSQFRSGNVASVIADALARTGLSPHRLLIEITESLLLDDRDDVMQQLTALKAMGTPIVMDDFGTGYSSLGYLWRFPFDKIKIDASFMRGIAEGETIASKVVQSITALGHALGMRVCVEGVETRNQAEFAGTIGCDEVQGFYYARPAPMADLASFVLSDFRKRTTKAADEAPAEPVVAQGSRTAHR